MSNYLQGARLPAISQEFLDAVDQAFELPTITPGADRDKLMYLAGQRYVVDWIKAQAYSIKSTPDPVAIAKATVRYGS